MKKLLDKNRKAELLTKLHLSLQKYDSLNEKQQLTSSQNLKQESANDQLTKQLNRLLESNQKRKNDLKQQLISGPVGIDLNQEMQQLRWRMDILKQNHSRQKKKSTSLSGKSDLSASSAIFEKQQKLTFNQLYNMQKQKYAALRQRRKTKRLNLQYIQMIGNKESRKQRNKQLNGQKFAEQMRLLDQAIQGN